MKPSLLTLLITYNYGLTETVELTRFRGGMAAVEYLVKLKELNQRENIDYTDVLWDSLISSPSVACKITGKEFYSNVTATIIRQLNAAKVHMWLLKSIERAEMLSRSHSAGTPGALGPQLSSCCRIIARICPVMYENTETHQLIWGNNVSTSENPLGKRIIDCLVTLMHFRGYTVPLEVTHLDHRMIWYPGIGCPTGSVTTTAHSSIMEARGDVLRAIIAVLSNDLYPPIPGCTNSLEYLTSCVKEPYMFCSLLNFGLHSPNWLMDKLQTRFSGASTSFGELHDLALCLLLLCITHLNFNKSHRNQFRRLLSRVNREEDFDMLCAKLSEKIKGKSGPTAVLSVCVAWELIQANSKFAKSPTCIQLGEALTTILQNSSEVERRLGAYCLLSLTAVNGLVSENIGFSLWRILASRGVTQLNNPDIQLASVIDMFYNCSTYTRFSELECNEFNEVRSKLTNTQVINVFKRIEQSQKGLDYSPIVFDWDLKRLQWYGNKVWGVALTIDPNILDVKSTNYFTQK